MITHSVSVEARNVTLANFTDQDHERVYLHNVLFLACFNWDFFQGVKIHDTMSLNQCTK